MRIKNITALVLACALVLVLGSCSKKEPGEEEKHMVEIVGMIRDNNHVPANGLEVVMIDEVRNSYIGNTDTQGAFVLTVPADNAFSFGVCDPQNEGYFYTDETVFSLFTGDSVSVDFEGKCYNGYLTAYVTADTDKVYAVFTTDENGQYIDCDYWSTEMPPEEQPEV